MTPESRKDGLLTQAVGDELVVYDESTAQAHRLNRTASLVWRLANGERTLGGLAKDLRSSIDSADNPNREPIGPGASEELVSMAIEQLDRAGLLVRGLPRLQEPMSRREMIAVTAALLPVVASIMAPTPAMAQTTNFAFYNGIYEGRRTISGDVGTCTSDEDYLLGSGPVRIVLDLLPNGSGEMTVAHVASITWRGTAEARVITALSITVNGVATAADLDSTHSVDFFLTVTPTARGHQNVVGSCGRPAFELSAERI